MNAEKPRYELKAHWALVQRLVDQVFSGSMLGTAFAEQLIQVIGEQVVVPEANQAFACLPLLTCEAAGGDPEQAVPVMRVWQLLRLAAKCFDDVEDGEAIYRAAETINIGTALVFLAQLILERAPTLLSECASQLRYTLACTALSACTGQQAEFVGRKRTVPYDPKSWQEIAAAKSAEPFAWAAWAGALVAGSSQPTLACYRKYGYHLGMLLQIADDFRGIWGSKEASDLQLGCINLPLCYAFYVASAEERVFLEQFLAQVARGDSASEARVRDVLISLGAQKYLLVVARAQYQEAVAAIESARCLSPFDQHLIALLAKAMPALQDDRE